MNKRVGFFVKAILFLSMIYIWPSCHKKGNDAASATKLPYDTTTGPLKGWVVSTLAGSGLSGYVDGDATTARFNGLIALTTDSNNNVFAAEVDNHCIRKITPLGEVSTFVKEEMSTNYVMGEFATIVTDKQGNFFIPGGKNKYYVRKLTATQSTIFAGSNVPGFKDGQDTSARFNYVLSINVDRNHNLCSPDIDTQGRMVIRKITSTGLVSTLYVTDNTGISNGLSKDFIAIAADISGNFYMGVGNQRSLIKKIDPQGKATILAGSTTAGFKDGKGQDAKFNGIVSLQVDSIGNVWACEVDNNTIRKISPDGIVTTVAGNGAKGYVNGNTIKSQLNLPLDIAIGKDGAIYINDAGNNVIRKLKYY